MQLRWYQSEAVSACWDFLGRNPSKNPVIVLPTGAGKSLVIAQLASDAVTRFGGKVLILAHRKELLEQNAAKVRTLCAEPVGIYSAGLRSRDIDEPIIVAGIQSAFDKAHLFGQRHVVIIDESHLIPFDGDGMYQRMLSDLKRYNGGFLRAIGLTATPFRTVGGALCRPDAIFQKICYDAPLRTLIDQGFLSPITNRTSEQVIDLSGVQVKGGEFVAGQMESAFNATGVVGPACREIVAKTHGRKSILVFCSGVYHAECVQKALEEMAREPVGLVTGQSTPLERQSTLAAFRGGHLRWLVNIDVLTTGFDHPGIDAIAVLRATMSPGLFVQMAGRGSRIAPGKVDALLLDFGGNLQRHGPIDDPSFGKRPDGGMVGEAPVKTCPACQGEVLIQTKQCPCGFLFSPAAGESDPSGGRHEAGADGQSAVLAEPEEFEVDRVDRDRHVKKIKDGEPAKPPSLRIDYWVKGAGGNLGRERPVSEWVCLEHDGFARRKAENWWREHSPLPVPATIEDAIQIIDSGGCRFAKAILVGKDKGFDRILRRDLPAMPDVGDSFELVAVDNGDEWRGEAAPPMAEEDLPF